MREPLLYLDASALVKLVLPEAESHALAATVATTSAHLSSVVAAVEVPRAVLRVTEDSAALRRCEQVIDGLDLRALDYEVVDMAARAMPRAIRSLDAIHLASAVMVGDELLAFVAYDRKLQDAAEQCGLPVAAPRS